MLKTTTVVDMNEVRATLAVLRVLKVFVDKIDDGDSRHHSTYGYELMQATGFNSGKVYQVLARLTSAGWLDRFDNPDASPESGGPPRITYRLRPEAVPAARRLVREAQADFAPAGASRARGASRVRGVIS